MGKQRVKLSRLNWDVEYYKDLIENKGFQITEPDEVTLDGTTEKSMYGPQSPLFGSTYEDEDAVIKRYRCKCGAFTSRLFEGEVCPVCGEKVECRDSDINMTGWINLGTNRIVNPYFYRIFDQTLGKNIFPDIINVKYKVTTNGNREALSSDDLEKPSSPYAGIGVDKFFEQYENIIAYFKSTMKSAKKHKLETLDALLKQKRAVFTSHIPVYTPKLRPRSVTVDTFYFGSMDKAINTTFNLCESLKTCADIERDYILYRIQTKVNKMWEINFDLLNGKDGIIRGELLGGSINNSARNVIIPAPDLKDNEVDLSYHTFLEMYKYKIMYYIMKLEDVSLSAAYDKWKRVYTFDQSVYDIMMYILEHDDPRLLINRNPTLNYYSMLLMKIRQIKPDDNDFCLSVPLSILPGLNADFDGDILNIIGLMDKSLVYMFRKFDPISRMIIDRDSGLLNSYFMVTKGQLIDLYYFCTIEGSDCDEEEEYDPENETPFGDFEIAK